MSEKLIPIACLVLAAILIIGFALLVEARKKKKRSDRQEYVSLYYSTNHYTNEDVLSSPSPRKRENTSTFRELNLDQQSFEDSYWSPA